MRVSSSAILTFCDNSIAGFFLLAELHAPPRPFIGMPASARAPLPWFAGFRIPGFASRAKFHPRKRSTDSGPSERSQRGLDWLSFFVADVQTGFGPFVSVYLARQHWNPGQIGTILAIGGVAGIACQVPGGALVDAVPAKRLLIALALGLLAAAGLLFALWPSFWPVALAELLLGASAGVLQPSLAAVGLGLVGHDGFSRRLARNQRFNSLGNAATGGAMGLLGHFMSKQLPFFAVAALCIPGILVLGMIRGEEIDYA